MADDLDRVVRLDELDDFEIADGDPDVRGWDVRSADGRRIGEVDNLLIDSQAMKVRYLDVDLDDALLEGGIDRHILVPIGYARLDEDGEQVTVDSLNAADVVRVPEYRREPVTTQLDAELHRVYGIDRGGTAPPAV